MKNLLITFLLFTAFLNAEAQNVKAIYDQHIGEGNYTVVTFNSALFQLASEYADNKEEANVAKGITGIKIFSAEACNDLSIKGELMKDLWSFFSNSAYTEFMRVEEKNDRVVFYLKKAGNKISELTLVAEEDASVIQISGDINLSEIAKLSKTMHVKGMHKLEEIDQ